MRISGPAPIYYPVKQELCVLRLTVTVPADPCDPDSIPLSFDTICLGQTKKKALSVWRSACPIMAALLTGITVIVPAPTTPAAKQSASHTLARFGKPRIGAFGVRS